LKEQVIKDDVLKNNKMIDLKKIDQFKNLLNELSSIGITVKNSYSLSSPLGDSPDHSFNIKSLNKEDA